MISALLHGIILAFGLIIPLGIQNIFVFNQGGCQHHFVHALPTVLTAAICDTLLILCAVLGISMAILTLTWLKMIFFIGGIIFLTYMGFVSWYSRPNHTGYAGQKPLTAKQQILFSLSVSILNPHALLDSIAVIGTSSLQFTGTAKWAFTMGCILVSWCWFFSLSVAGHFFHQWDHTGRWQLVMNRLSALILWGVALYLSMQLFKL